jgi:glycosyltransferase involved in cell wall biosynthesis
MTLRYALIGDAQSPHLLKWAQALGARVDLWVVSSRGLDPAFDGLVAPSRRLALDTRPRPEGGNARLLWTIPRVAAWLRRIDADVLHFHYLTSHGALALLARRLAHLHGMLVGSAWGSDVLLTPERSPVHRWLTARVLRACTLATSDSEYMAARMRELGAREVMVFPFGLEALPPQPEAKAPWLFFANRALEPLYRPDRVLRAFAAVAALRPDARLVIANNGSLAAALETQARQIGLRVGELGRGGQVQFVGRLDAPSQARWYAAAQWYLSLPSSDSVSVSVLEAMAHGCIPLLSELPANRELVRHAENGLIVSEADSALVPALESLAARAGAIARENRRWVTHHGLFAPAVERFLARVGELVGDANQNK